MQENTTQFGRVLGRRRRWWQAGELVCVLLRIGRLALWLALGCGALDLLLAPPAPVLIGLEVLAGGWLAFVLLWELISVAGFNRREMAARADQLLKRPRQPVLSAYELQTASAGTGGEFQQYLIGRSLNHAAEALASLPLSVCWPRGETARQLKRLVLAAAVVGAVAAVNPVATLTIASRLRHPGSDIPPYSPLQFAVTPERAQVLYGGTLELKVEIKGAPVRQPVRLLIRKGEQADEAICFREGETVFSQRIEKVVDPVEICFRSGKARSRWLPVTVLLQPRISALKLALEPPAYTHLPRRESVLGGDSIEGYAGSKARLQLTSNRPLARGALTVTPLDGIAPARLINGERTGEHTLAFAWDVRQPARLEVNVHDVQGTALAEPLRLTQKLIPDKPPDVTLHSPAAYALATPSSVVPVRGGAWDDLALRQVELVRAVVGFRDRMTALGPPLPEQRFEFTRELNLRQLGVLPGQVIELYVEARDFNPARTGVGTSPIARIEVIPESEYAEMIRANESLQQFLDRYYAARDNLEDFRREFEELKRELQKPNPDREKIARLLDQARKRNQELQKFFSQLASDFKAYAIEGQLQEALKEMNDRLQGHETLLAGMAADNSRLPEVVDRILRDFQKDEQKLRQQVAQAEEIARVGRVMEQAAAFMELLNRQRHLVRQLQRFERQLAADSEDVDRYGREQADILKDLESFLQDLPKAANNLPEDEAYADLRKSAIEFARALRETGADKDMGSAVSAARNQDGRSTWHWAQLALEKMEGHLRKCQGEGSCFGGMCRNQFSLSMKDELKETLCQMLAAMLGRGHGGEGRKTGEGGGGAGGEDGDGYWVPARTRLNTPVFGPPRSSFRHGGVQGFIGRGGVGNAAGAGEENEAIAGPAQKQVGGQGRSPALVPEKYREALKRYFHPAEEKP